MLRSLFFQELLAMKAQKDNEESAPLPNGIRDHKGFTKARYGSAAPPQLVD